MPLHVYRCEECGHTWDEMCRERCVLDIVVDRKTCASCETLGVAHCPKCKALVYQPKVMNTGTLLIYEERCTKTD